VFGQAKPFIALSAPEFVIGFRDRIPGVLCADWTLHFDAEPYHLFFGETLKQGSRS
jgi:hypothetical protein